MHNEENDPTYNCGTFTAYGGKVLLQQSVTIADPLHYSALAQVQAQCNALVNQLGFYVNGERVNSVQAGAVHTYDQQAGYNAGCAVVALNTGFAVSNDFCAMYSQARAILNQLQKAANNYIPGHFPN